MNDPGFTMPLECDGFRARLHFSGELDPSERRTFDRHAAGCRACAQLLLETERLDDLLLQWHAPTADPSFTPSVMERIAGRGPTANCAEATASLHHFVAGDLEPWLAARVERHVAHCAACADHLDETRHSRKLWLHWRAPDPSRSFADDLIRRLEPETRAARRRRELLRLVFGPVRVPRVAAALVLCSVTLLAIGVLRMRSMLPTARPEIARMHVDGHLPIVPTQYAPQIGRSDPTGSLSPDVRAGKESSLRSALRGK